MNERYVTLSHGRTRYFEAGEGAPVILLHGVGFTAGGDSWFLNVGPLSQGLRVLAPDFLGWGTGDRLPIGYSFAYLVDFVREFQDALGLEKSHIVGHSMGGWIATVFAYESPDRVDKLVLVGAGGVAPRTLHSMTSFQPPTRDQLRGQLESRIKKEGVDLETLLDQQVAIAGQPGAVESYQLILDHMNNGATRQRYNTVRRLPRIRAKTLIVWGDGDTTNSPDMAEALHQGIAGSKLVMLKDCGHFVPTERPDEFNRAVGEFLGG
jgi:pimeloyl-ACP methyl ester carboxylesterase